MFFSQISTAQNSTSTNFSEHENWEKRNGKTSMAYFAIDFSFFGSQHTGTLVKKCFGNKKMATKSTSLNNFRRKHFLKRNKVFICNPDFYWLLNYTIIFLPEISWNDAVFSMQQQLRVVSSERKILEQKSSNKLHYGLPSSEQIFHSKNSFEFVELYFSANLHVFKVIQIAQVFLFA